MRAGGTAISLSSPPRLDDLTPRLRLNPTAASTRSDPPALPAGGFPATNSSQVRSRPAW